MSTRWSRHRSPLEAIAPVSTHDQRAACPAREPCEPAPAWRIGPVPTRHDAIAARAREIWVSRGRPSGQDLEIWFAAESELFDA